MKIDRLIGIIFILLQKDKLQLLNLQSVLKYQEELSTEILQTFVKWVFQLLLHKAVVVEYPFLTATK